MLQPRPLSDQLDHSICYNYYGNAGIVCQESDWSVGGPLFHFTVLGMLQPRDQSDHSINFVTTIILLW